ncbi:MAG: hypothetical protein ACE5HD_01010 [Acidobacteriota bacterium]
MIQPPWRKILVRLLMAGQLVVLPVPAFPSRGPVQLNLADTEIPEDSRLDVGIEVFHPGLDEDDEHALEEKGIYPGVRKSEARFMPFHLKNILESTGQWGAVRVVPPGTVGADVTVSGEILESTGLYLNLKIKVEDSRGRVWWEKKYKQEADAAAYGDAPIENRGPFEDLYSQMANDMLAARERLDARDLKAIHDVTAIRFAVNIVPEVFSDYLEVSHNGRYVVRRLPAVDDPMVERLARIRDRDDMFVDTLNEYYADFYARMSTPYDNWRQFSWEEQTALREIRRKARRRKILASLLLFGGVAANGSGAAAETARQAAVIGGALVLQSGIEKGKEGKIHVAALKELAASFEAEIEPTRVEVEGKSLRLRGSAETQYAEWRKFLAEIFANETGQTLDPDTLRPEGAQN